MPTTRIPYTELVDPTERSWAVLGPRDDKPRVKGCVYFTYRGEVCEADLSPDAKFESMGFNQKKLVSGHIRILCPLCVMEGRPAGSLHVMHNNHTVFVHEDDPKSLIQYRRKTANELYFLPSLTVCSPVGCDYREPSAGSCDWKVTIREGRAVDASGGGQIFLTR